MPTLDIDYQVAQTSLEGDRVRVTLNQVAAAASNVVPAGPTASSLSMSLSQADAKGWTAGDLYTVTLAVKAAPPAPTPAAPQAQPQTPASATAAGPVNATSVDAAAKTG